MATSKKISTPSVKDPILAKIGYLHKLLSRVSKLLVGTVYRGDRGYVGHFFLYAAI
jgi:hypothetical protein